MIYGVARFGSPDQSQSGDPSVFAYQANLQQAFLQSAMAQNIRMQQQLLAQNQAFQQLLLQQRISVRITCRVNYPLTFEIQLVLLTICTYLYLCSRMKTVLRKKVTNQRQYPTPPIIIIRK